MTASDISILAYDSSDEYRPEPAPEPQPPAWRDGSIRIGIHTSIAQGFAGSLESASQLGCNALQIFSASPRMWPRVGSRIAEMDAAEFRAKRAELGLGPLVIHANYLINLATSDPVLRVRSIQAFHDEMVRGAALGADYLVVHPGSSRGKTSAQAIRDVAQAIRQAARGARLCATFGDLRDCRLRLLLENTSGMGAAIGSRFEELKAIMDGAPELPLGVCLDTAHAFHAGRAFLLEPPIDAPGDDRRNVRRLWDLVGIAVKQAPRAQNGFTMLARKATIRSGSSSRATNLSEGPLRNLPRTTKSRPSKG